MRRCLGESPLGGRVTVGLGVAGRLGFGVHVRPDGGTLGCPPRRPAVCVRLTDRRPPPPPRLSRGEGAAPVALPQFLHVRWIPPRA